MKTIDEIFDDVQTDIPWATNSLIVAFKDICKDICEYEMRERNLQNENNIINGNVKSAI